MKKSKSRSTASTATIPNNPDPSLIGRLADGSLAAELGLDRITFNPLLDLADRLVEEKSWREAMELYAKLELADPANPEVQIGLARCATELGEHELALTAAANVIRLAPEDPRGYLLSGKNCLMLGQHREAREDLADAAQLAGRNTPLASQASLLLTQVDVLMSGDARDQA